MEIIESGQQFDTLNVNDNETLVVGEDIIAPIGEPAVDLIGDNARLVVLDNSISAPDLGNSAVLSSGSNNSILNQGDISGALNGISASGNNFRLVNQGTTSSDSRAVDITDGDGSTVINSGTIIGTGDQRNGTLYVDGTVDDLRVINTNSGSIDAGVGNLGDGISVQVGAAGDPSNDNITLSNRGVIQGRGTGPAVFANGGRVAANGSSGVRLFNGSGEPEATISGSIVNNGTITSEANVGFLGGLVVEDGVAFQGRIINNPDGLISGPRNGLYIGNAEHDLQIINSGDIVSGSRAVNLDGDNVSLINIGNILGNGDQRNGTLYVDGTGDDIEIINGSQGRIDAGIGNSGSGVSVQVGATSNGVVDDNTSASIINSGIIQGRGTDNVPAGVRFFVGSGLEEATFSGNVINQNNGVIASETDAGILIESGVNFDGRISNTGTISGGNGFAINADGALGDLEVLNRGTLIGDVQLGTGNDRFVQGGSDGVLAAGGAGNDTLLGGSGNDTLIGGTENDFLNGRGGTDTADFSDLDVPVTVTLNNNGNGTATRQTGFAVSFSDVEVDSLNPDAIPNDGAFLSEALAGNLYFNVHSNDFNGGEIRGQLDTIVSDTTASNGTRTIVISATLDASQEPGPLSDSEAVGTGEVTLNVDVNGNVSYDLELSTIGLATSDLLPVAGFSAIHLHNAPAGINGPVILDVIQDAGGDIFGQAQSPSFDTGDGNVFSEILEIDTLRSIENVRLSNDNDVAIAGSGSNLLEGLAGDDELAGGAGADTLNGGLGNDTLRGGGGTDVIAGGLGFDTNDFSDINAAAADSTIAGVSVILDADGTGNAQYLAGGIAGNPVISEDFTGIEAAIGSVNNDSIRARGRANNSLSGGAGSDILSGGAGNDTLIGGVGNDTLRGQGGNDTLRGGGGTDVIFGGSGFDINDFSDINVSAADRAIAGVSAFLNENGTGNVQYLAGGLAGNPVIFEEFNGIEGAIGTVNNDRIIARGDAINDLRGGAGADFLVGALGDDTLNGGTFNDSLFGGSGNDVLLGGNGNDILAAGTGNDILTGGAGNDTLTGGNGVDTFVFNANSGIDLITDFTSSDRLDISSLVSDIDDILGLNGTATQVGNDTQIDFGDNSGVILANTRVSELSSNNFSLGA